MTDDVDITAPTLPPVKDRETETTAPTLQPVKETVAALEPVQSLSSTTLDLDEQEDISTDLLKLPEAQRKKRRDPTTVPLKDLDAGAKPPPSTGLRKALVKAPLRGDGFEGSGLTDPSLSEAAPVTSRSAQLVALAHRNTWLVVGLVALGVGLIAFVVWQLW